MIYLGDFEEDSNIRIPFNTFDAVGASVTVTDLTATDVHIHRDGLIMGNSPRNNAAGIAISINHDGITGNHLLTIDTNDDTVADFWVTGLDYQVRLEGITVATKTLNVWIGAFSIENRFPSLADINAEVDTALSDINLDHFIQTASTVNDASATTTSFDTNLTEASNDHYNNSLLVFTDNALAGQARRITDYVGSTKVITVYPAFTEAPANGDAFVIVSGYYFRIPGAGALEITYTVKKDDEDTGDPIDGAEVWITTDSAGNNVIWSGTTNASGVLLESGGSKPWLDAGTYFFWRKKSGFSFVNPDEEVFSA